MVVRASPCRDSGADSAKVGLSAFCPFFKSQLLLCAFSLLSSTVAKITSFQVCHYNLVLISADKVLAGSVLQVGMGFKCSSKSFYAAGTGCSL